MKTCDNLWYFNFINQKNCTLVASQPQWKPHTEDWCWDVQVNHSMDLNLFSSFYIRPHDMWVWENVWEKCGWTALRLLVFELTQFHHVVCRSFFPFRHWQKDWSTTPPWKTWIWLGTTLALKGLRLGVWWGWWGSWGIGHEGERYCSRDRARANRRWNGEMSERKTTENWCWDVPSPSCRSEWIWTCSLHFIYESSEF